MHAAPCWTHCCLCSLRGQLVRERARKTRYVCMHVLWVHPYIIGTRVCPYNLLGISREGLEIETSMLPSFNIIHTKYYPHLLKLIFFVLPSRVLNLQLFPGFGACCRCFETCSGNDRLWGHLQASGRWHEPSQCGPPSRGQSITFRVLVILLHLGYCFL